MLGDCATDEADRVAGIDETLLVFDRGTADRRADRTTNHRAAKRCEIGLLILFRSNAAGALTVLRALIAILPGIPRALTTTALAALAGAASPAQESH